MNTISILYVIIIALCVIAATLATFSAYIPMIVDRKSWKIWKQCYNDNNFVKTDENEHGARYHWIDSGYHAIVFKHDDEHDAEYDAAIFGKGDSKYDSPLFCTFYSYHSKKLAKKLMSSNR